MTVPPLVWGTARNPRAVWLPFGKVHIVRPDRTPEAWCGLPVEHTWPARPTPRPGHPVICPECSINYLAASYPATASTP
jgi:hypothetical protein